MQFNEIKYSKHVNTYTETEIVKQDYGENNGGKNGLIAALKNRTRLLKTLNAKLNANTALQQEIDKHQSQIDTAELEMELIVDVLQSVYDYNCYQ